MQAGQEAREHEEWDPVEPQTMLKGLKCPVCWEYFTRPHTIPCGHTFCTRCLMTLARLARTSRNRPLDRLRFRCPACRRNTLASPILRRRAAVNYAIRNLVDEWFNSPYSSGKVEYLTLRSFATQTEHIKRSERTKLNDSESSADADAEDDDDDVETPDDISEDQDEIISETEFREILVHRINCKSKPQDCATVSPKEPLDLSMTSHEVESAEADENVVSSSSDDSQSEQEIGPLFANLNVVADNNNEQIQRPPLFLNARLARAAIVLFFSQCLMTFRAIRRSRSRMLLTIFWFLYGIIIVCISSSFLPWMSFYTVIYFVIIYAELNPPEVTE